MPHIVETALFMVAAGVLVLYIKHRRNRKAL